MPSFTVDHAARLLPSSLDLTPLVRDTGFAYGRSLTFLLGCMAIVCLIALLAVFEMGFNPFLTGVVGEEAFILGN